MYVIQLRIDEFMGHVSVFVKIDRELHNHCGDQDIKMSNTEMYSHCILKIIVDINNKQLVFPVNNFIVKVHEDNTNWHCDYKYNSEQTVVLT